MYCILQDTNLLRGRSYVKCSYKKREGRRKLLEVMDVFMTLIMLICLWVFTYVLTLRYVLNMYSSL